VRIALVSPYDFAYPGGVTVHVSQLKAQLQRMGHKVSILAPCSKPDDFIGEPALIPIGRPYPLPMGGSVARIALSLTLAAKVKSALREGEFEVVHLHEPLVPALPITVLRFSQSINVGTFHAFHGTSRLYRYTRRILRRWFRKLHGKIAVSRPAMEFISKYFPGFYNVIPNGINLEMFSPQVIPIPELRDGKFNILFVGRMEKRKGLKYLLGAYARIKWYYPNIRLIIVSPQKLNRECEQMISERDIRDVLMFQNIPYQLIPRYYRSADVFCSPAIGKESFGIVLLEAMAAGTPVIATQIPGHASIITHEQEGLLVPPQSEEAIAAALMRVLEEKGLREGLAEAGQAAAMDYGWESIAEKVEGYYRRLLSERPPVVSAFSP